MVPTLQQLKEAPPLELMGGRKATRESDVLLRAYGLGLLTDLTVGSEEAHRCACLRPPPKLHIQISRMQLSRRLSHAERQGKKSTRLSSQTHTHGTAW
jgi:hypothetical protein